MEGKFLRTLSFQSKSNCRPFLERGKTTLSADESHCDIAYAGSAKNRSPSRSDQTISLVVGSTSDRRLSRSATTTCALATELLTVPRLTLTSFNHSSNNINNTSHSSESDKTFRDSGKQDSLLEPPNEKRSLTSSFQNLFTKESVDGKRPKRLIEKNGEYNVSHLNVPKQHKKFISDIFTTIIDTKWRWSLLFFTATFFASWIVFAAIYAGISYLHMDFSVSASSNFTPCLTNANSFTAIFLFSIETQHTIGYGYRHITEQCPPAILLMCIQSIFGIMIQSFLTGFVFTKLARPKKRAETLIFSKNAVICMRDGHLCFLFRVGDMRKTHIVECHIRLQIIKKRLTLEGEQLPFNQFDMNVGYDTGQDRIFLVWPITICHVIDENSPLYDYSAADLESGAFEIIAILEGSVESTGMTTQARTSYLPSEILWGHRLEKLVTYEKAGDYQVDFNMFHNSCPVATPLCSAKRLDEMDLGNGDDLVFKNPKLHGSSADFYLP